MTVKPNLAEDISIAISCMQDYRDTLDIDTESWYKIGERIERLFKFYYQLIGFYPNEDEGWKHAKYFDGTKWVDSWGENK